MVISVMDGLNEFYIRVLSCHFSEEGWGCVFGGVGVGGLGVGGIEGQEYVLVSLVSIPMSLNDPLATFFFLSKCKYIYSFFYRGVRVSLNNEGNWQALCT